MELEMAAAAAAASAESRQLEAIFIATPPCTPLIASLTRTTTPRDLPTMYHFDFPNMSSTAAEDESLPPPPGPLTTGLTVPIPEEGETSNDLTPCPNCSRTFNLNALRKHVIVCEKTLKKRKPFDSSRQRRDGTALSTYVLPKNFGLPNAEKASGVHSPPVSREASTLSTVVPHKVAVGSPQPAGSNLIRSTARGSMRRAGGATITAAAESVPAAAPAAPATMNRDGLRASERSVTRRSIKGPASERCPHCDRSFNLKAFDRHVEWCKEKAIQAHIKQNTIVENNKAKERMEARKQYRPPNLKTKRAINRDKYSGTQEEQYEAEMVAQKQNIMSHSSMTSSVQSDNIQRKAAQPTKLQRPGTPLSSYHSPPRETKKNASTTTTTIAQNTIRLRMGAEESNEASQQEAPPPAYVNPKRKQRQTCQEIDVAVARLRRTATDESLSRVAKLECAEAAPLQPARSRRALTNRQKIEAIENLAAVPQATMSFEELNGLIKRKGGTNICNIKMDLDGQQTLKMAPKQRSSTSLVRQARRRIRTRENPSIDLRSLEPPKASSTFDLTSKDQHDVCALPAPVPFHRTPNNIYSGSEDEANSNCGEIQIKMKTSTIHTVVQPRKRTNLPAIINNSEPMRALPMPELKQSLEALSKTLLPRLELSNAPKDHYKEEQDDDFDGYMDLEELDYDEADAEVGQLLSKAKLLKRPYDDEFDYTSDIIDSEEDEEKQVLMLNSQHKQRSNVSRRLVLLEQDEEGTMYIKAPRSPTKRLARSPPSMDHKLVNSGLSSHASNKYDPFLSAKRQLEELCSPNTPPDNEPLINSTVTTPTMSTSLTSTLGKLYINTPTTTATTPKVTPMSSFRRTSSLRGPRRTPLLPSRPLFASNYRPTIQRGLSDEGPISSNFLKPEEFDEMPVRAACVNDFHSPRVIRRDTSASNRKQHLKLPLGGATESDTTTNTPSTPKPTVRNVAKTDSLAVFLNYEHELEQLNAKAAEVAAHTKELSSKELKDKSNNLSKQNSAKNLATNPSSGPLPPLTLPNKENHVNLVQTYATPLRLEPISKPMTPVTPNSSGSTLPIKLESIFGVGNRLGDYIDPKLINACDNLHVQQSSTGSSEASSTPQQISQSRSSSQSTITMGPEQRRHSGEARNLLKRKMRLGRNQFLYDASPEEAYISSGSCADDEANRSSLEFDEQCWQQQQKQLLSKPLSMPMTMPTLPVLPTFDDFDFEEFLSSFENENDEEQFPLFRDCREFLLNRTTSRQRSFQKATSTPQTQTQTQTQTQIQTQLPTPTATQRPSTTGCQFKSNFYAATTKDPHAHRSDSNVSSSGGSMKSTTVNSSGSYKTPNSSSGSYKTTLNSSGEKMQRQQSNISTGSSSNSCHGEHAQKLVDDSQKREIFISIETEPNAQGRSPISPDSLRHMVGNAQTPIDVLHIENGNEPEHAKFSKISDTEDHLDAELDDEASHVLYKKRLTSMASTAAKTITAAATAATTATTTMPNVEANNAKNVLEKMRCDFKQLGEDVGASMRRDILQRQEQIQQQQQLQAQQDTLKVSTPLTPSPSGDSDELSSLDGYPMSSSQSSRRGAGSKLSSDSAYGSTNSPFSLSRQRSSELQSSNNNTPRSQTQLRPHTASGSLTLPSKTSSTMMNALMQATSNYGTPKTRQRLFAGSGGEGGLTEYSSSSSEHLVPQQQQQQQQQPQQQQQSTDYNYNNKSSNNSYELNAKNLNNNNNNNNNNSIGITPTTSQHSLLSNNSSNGSSSMSASMKMSKFCHECGGKFVIEHAKFCMECGVKRVVL